jgi:Xaa-Pro aminopeptidase
LQWLDAYHVEVMKKLGPKVDPETLPWLQQACAALT